MDRTPRRRGQGDARLALCVLVAWVWLWRWVDPSRVYFGASLTGLPAFSPDAVFVRAHGQVAGGLLGYGCAWLSQLWIWPGLAAGLLALAAACVAVAADYAVAGATGRRVPGLRYGPFLLCLLLDGRYHHLLDWQVGWALALWAAGAALRWRETRPGRRAAVILPGLIALYCLLGGPALVAVPLLAVGEARRPAWPLATAVLAAPLWMPALVWLVWFDDPLAMVYAALVPGLSGFGQSGLARVAAVGLLAYLFVAAVLAPRLTQFAQPRLAWLAPLVVCALLACVGRNEVAGRGLELHKRAARGDWPGLLAAAEPIAPQAMTQYDAYNVLMALAHTGQVGDRLLRLGLNALSTMRDNPQLAAGGSEDVMRAQCGLLLRDLDLQLGLVNEAEHAFHETLETQGTYPALLVPMARVQLMKDRPQAARVFLHMAAAQPGDPAGARPLLRRLRSDPALAGDEMQRTLSANRVRADRYDQQRLEPLLEQATREHPDNRLAQEYLLALYLFNNRIDRIAVALPTLVDPARDTLPRHVEEALLCQEIVTGKPVDTGRRTISAAARKRLDDLRCAMGCDRDRMVDVLYAPRRVPRCALRVWQTAFADTYYYYRMFGVSGVPR
ncbi:MAG: hypothetical protein HZB16_23160 [Armatimonadetes bacterium]|nr:hypothetical protein [Armatimonadota bacterium]